MNATSIVALDANTLLVGGRVPTGADSGSSLGGALWRSADGGRTWARIAAYAGPPPLALATNGSRIWAAAGCIDGGCQPAILTSADQGATWTERSHRLVTAISAIDADHLWAIEPGFSPDGGTVLRSADGGRRWTDVAVACPVAWPTAASFLSATRGWVGCGGGGSAGQQLKAIVETRDGGRTWAVRSEVSLDRSVGTITISDYVGELLMRPSGVGLMLMGRGTTIRTQDGGRTWIDTPLGEFDCVIPAAASLVDDQTWYAVSPDCNRDGERLFVTTDGGQSWEALAAAP